jgi:hypothetical protein
MERLLKDNRKVTRVVHAEADVLIKIFGEVDIATRNRIVLHRLQHLYVGVSHGWNVADSRKQAEDDKVAGVTMAVIQHRFSSGERGNVIYE